MKKAFIRLAVLSMLFVFYACATQEEDTRPELEVEILDVVEQTQDGIVDEPQEEEIVELEVEEGQATPYSINTTVFMYLGKTPEEVTDLAGEHIETIWFSGWWHKFGDYWFVFDDDEHPTGQSIVLFCELSDIVDGITSDIEVSELDKLFGQQATFSSVENSELFSVGYLQYEHQSIEISIDAEPNTRIGKDAFVRLRIL